MLSITEAIHINVSMAEQATRYVVKLPTRFYKWNYCNCIANTHAHYPSPALPNPPQLTPPRYLAGTGRPSSQPKSCSGWVWHWASSFAIALYNGCEQDGKFSLCCQRQLQRRCQQSVPRLFGNCLFLFFSLNSCAGCVGGGGGVIAERACEPNSREQRMSNCISLTVLFLQL